MSHDDKPCPTPRTDAAREFESKNSRIYRGGAVEELCRQLERELAEEREKNEQKLLKAMEFGARSVRSSTPRSSYEPLTKAQIEHFREYGQVEEKGMPPSKVVHLLCNMAVNCLLYAEEIQRLRDTPLSAIAPSAEAVDIANLCVGRAGYEGAMASEILRLSKGTP